MGFLALSRLAAALSSERAGGESRDAILPREAGEGGRRWARNCLIELGSLANPVSAKHTRPSTMLRMVPLPRFAWED
jgi:hypothetical protein